MVRLCAVFTEMLQYFSFFLLINISLQQVEDEFRLPKVVQPKIYQIRLTFLKDFYQSLQFEGSVTIQLRTAAADIKEIKLHSYHTTNITHASLKRSQGPVDNKTISITDLQKYNETTNILTLPLGENLEENNTYLLQIDYGGKVNVDTLNGIFRTSYKDSAGSDRYLLSTQFETTHARKAFPCFDEPGFKTFFHLTVNHPEDYSALSNTPIRTSLSTPQKTVFGETPKMPTYLLAFVISDFNCTSGDSVDNIPYRVCSSPVTGNIRNHALVRGPVILKNLATYMNISYSEHKIGKIDQIAIPGWGSAAMENWGLVTYGEPALLYDPDHSTNRNLQSITVVIAHELAHQWFGNLVTCHWWSDAFLNEGFATYFEYFITAQSEPSWELDKQFAIEKVQSILSKDSSIETKPISNPFVSKPSEISERFGSISYEKGATVLRMIETIMTPEKFRNALRNYLKNNLFGSGTKEKLYEAFEQETIEGLPANSLQEVLKNWIETPGYPVLSVKALNRSILISQKRFFDPPVNITNNQKWYVPISYTSSNYTNAGVVPKIWLPISSGDITLENILETQDSWIVLNNLQRGYFRVDYDDDILKRISSALVKNVSIVDEVNRAQIVDDLFALAKLGHSYSKAFNALSFLNNDDSYYPWYSFLKTFSSIYYRIGDSNIRLMISNYVLDLMKNVYKNIPFDHEERLPINQIHTLKKVLVLTWACRLNLKDCVDNSEKQFEKYTSNSMKPDRNLRSLIYCSGIRHSQRIAEDWNFLWIEYTKTQLPTEQSAILASLACTLNKEHLESLIEKVIKAEIPESEAVLIFSSIYNENPENLIVVLDFLHNNHEKIAKALKASTVKSIISGAAARITSEKQLEILRHLAGMADVDDLIKVVAADGIKEAEKNLIVTENIEKQLREYFVKTNNSGSNILIGFAIVVFNILLLELF